MSTASERVLLNDWSYYVEKLGTVTDPDEFDAVCNTMRIAHGLPPVGHKLTYEFFVAQRSVGEYRATWGREKVPAMREP